MSLEKLKSKAPSHSETRGIFKPWHPHEGLIGHEFYFSHVLRLSRFVSEIYDEKGLSDRCRFQEATLRIDHSRLSERL
jgi:hypothetical protein